LIGETNDSSNISHETPIGGSILPNQNVMENISHDAFGVNRHHRMEANKPTEEVENNIHRLHNIHDEDLINLIRYYNEELYEGCAKYSKLSFLIKLYHIKCFCRMTNKAMSMIIELLHDAFEHAKIPSSLYEAKKIINKLGLDYSKIDACPNDCMLYWGDDASRESCKVCQTSRWKVKDNARNTLTKGKKKKPTKILRYFPLKPRLQRLYMCSKTANHIR